MTDGVPDPLPGAGNNGLEMLRKARFEYVKLDHGVILAARDGSGRGALMAIPGVGTVAYIIDTEGNVVGALEPEG